MQIIETKLLGKAKNQNLCEDGLFIKEHLVVVIDGVTSKSDELYYGFKSGKYAKDVIIDELNKLDLFQDTLKIIKALDLRLKKEALKRFNNSVANKDYLRACLLIYNDLEKKLYSYGDSQFIVNGQYFPSYMAIDDINSQKRATKIKALLSQGYTTQQLLENDLGRKSIEEALLNQSVYENKVEELGYACLNGFNYNSKLLKVINVTDNEVVMASDGYPKLFNNLEASEAYLSSILKNDPLCYRLYLSTKGLTIGNLSFDDRCFVKINCSNK